MRELSKEDIRDKLSMILSSIVILEQRTVGINSGLDFMISFERVTLFDSCVLRLWQQIYSMRNFISHEYSQVDEDIVFQVIKEDLPSLKAAVKDILERSYL